jgi:hypothetical protein
VKRVVNGVVDSTAIDPPVNFGSERGLLGIALHPDFPTNPGVYLFWTESSTGADTGVLSETPLLGNRVDRFVWTGSALVFDRGLIRLRAIQQDFTTVTTPFGTFTQPERGNHDGGVIAFGPDRKLYVLFGDVGRRGQLQNLPNGPFGPGVPDDQFGGPQPDDAHFSGGRSLGGTRQKKGGFAQSRRSSGRQFAGWTSSPADSRSTQAIALSQC